MQDSHKAMAKVLGNVTEVEVRIAGLAALSEQT